jgi:predicted porin
MNNTLRLTVLAAALAGAFPALAQSNAEVLNELKALRDRVAELEKKLQAAEAAKPKDGQWGMTPEQARELNRVTIKTEAMEDSRDAQGLKNLTISGYADPTFIWNQRQNRAGFQFLNNVADDGYNYDNSYFGAISLDFQKETDSGTRYRLTIVPNRGTDSVIGNGGLVHEATISVPLSDLQTRFIAGHMPDWSGYEYLQPTLNKLITHNLLFDFTLPTSYTGAGLDITRGKWWYRGMIGNLNASKNPSDETGQMIAYRVDYSRGEFQGFGFAGVHGKAPNFTENVIDPITSEVIGQPNSRVDLFEFDAYFIRGDVTMQGQISFGQQKKASITPSASGALRDSRWWGVSVLGAYKFDPRLEGIVRLDYLNNKKNGGGLLGYTFADGRNGIGPDPNGDPDKGANRTALSLGLSYAFNLDTTIKAEYRLDRANVPVFEDVKSGNFKKTNNLFGTSVVVAF